MKIRNKTALLVGFCTFFMLGCYYLLSWQSASNAIIDFHKRSAIVIERSTLNFDLLQQVLKNHSATTGESLFKQLFQRFPHDHFFILKDKQLKYSTLSDVELSLVSDANKRGFYLKLKGPNNTTSVIYLNNEPLPVLLAGNTYGVLSLPKSVLRIGNNEEELRTSLHQRFILWFAVLSLIAMGLAWLGARYFLSPMVVLQAGFTRLEQGDFSVQLVCQRTDEVGHIFHSFNQLSSQLLRLQQQYNQMSTDIAHELRTPLTALRSRLEAIQDGLLQTDTQQVDMLLDDLQNLTCLVEDLHLLSLTEAGQLKIELQSVDLTSMLQHLYQAYLPLAQKIDLEFELVLQKSLVLADPLRLRQVLTNLLDNAFKYCATGKKIRLSLQTVGTNWQLEITDQGPGIQARPTQLVFERFYRDPISGKQPGSGLGLAICKKLTELMNGQLSVHSTPGKGSSFFLQLPAIKTIS